MGAVLYAEAEAYSGPIPDPRNLERFQAIYPDAPKIIFDMYKAQVEHRIAMEAEVVRSNNRNRSQGRIAAVIVAGMVLVLAGYAFRLNHPWAAGFIAAIDLTGLTAAHLGAAHIQSEERVKKKVLQEKLRKEARPQAITPPEEDDDT